MITRRTPITGNGRGERRCLRASNRPPLPILNALRAPDSAPLTFRSEISQEIARRYVGNLCVDQTEKSARQASLALSHLTTHLDLVERRAKTARELQGVTVGPEMHEEQARLLL